MTLFVRQSSAMEHVFAMGGRALWQQSCDAGKRRMLADVAGAPLRAWDERGHTKRATYDAARRATHAYEDETELVEWGVTPVLRYDALGRLTRTDLPNGTFSRVVFDPWMQTTFDPNDNVAPFDSSDTAGESLWYQARKALDPVTDPEGRAASLAYAHRATPGVAHLDALGRTFLTMEDNGAVNAYGMKYLPFVWQDASSG